MGNDQSTLCGNDQTATEDHYQSGGIAMHRNEGQRQNMRPLDDGLFEEGSGSTELHKQNVHPTTSAAATNFNDTFGVNNNLRQLQSNSGGQPLDGSMESGIKQTAHFTEHSSQPHQQLQSLNGLPEHRVEEQYWDVSRGEPYDPKKIEMIERLLYQANSESIDGAGPSTRKKNTPAETQQLVHRLLEKGKQIEMRNHLTQDYYEQRDLEQCTFQPSRTTHNTEQQPSSAAAASLILRSTSPKRSLQEFLRGQDKFLEAKQLNLKRLQMENQRQELEGCSHTPSVLQTSKVVMIAPKGARKYDSEPAYRRLYNLQKRKQEAEKNKLLHHLANGHDDADEDNSGGKKKSKKQLLLLGGGGGQQSQPNQQAIERLYSLGKMKVAAKREGPAAAAKQKAAKANQASDQSSHRQDIDETTTGQPTLVASKQSEFCLAQKLIKEYEQIVAIVIEDLKKQGYLLDYIQVSEVFRLMGFVSFSEKVESHNFVKERTLVNDVWIVLRGSSNAGVSYRNLLLFIFAIMGIDIDLPKFRKGDDENHLLSIQHSKDHAFPLLRDVAEVHHEDMEDQQQLQQQQLIRASRLSHRTEHTQSRDSSNGGGLHHQNASQKLQQFDDNLQHGRSEEGGKSSRGNLLSVQQQHQRSTSGERARIDYDSNNNLKGWMSQRSAELRLGAYDTEGNLSLSHEEVKQIQVLFYLFYINRLHTEKSKTKYINNPATDGHHHPTASIAASTSPAAHTSSLHAQDSLAQNYRSRQWDQSVSNEKLQRLGERVKHADILIAQKEEQQKYREYLREQKKDDDLIECTFHPKTNNYQQPQQMYLSSPFTSSSQQQQSPDFAQASTMTQRPNNNPMPPTSLGNKRFLDLYNLAKPRSQLRDKKTLEVEYEKNCDECTFNPDIAISNNKTSNQLHQGGYRPDLTCASLGQPKQVEVKNKDATVDRLRKAHEDSMNLQLRLSRGYYEFKDKSTQHFHQNNNQHHQGQEHYQSQEHVLRNNRVQGEQAQYSVEHSGYPDYQRYLNQQQQQQNGHQNYQDDGNASHQVDGLNSLGLDSDSVPQFGNFGDGSKDESNRDYDWMLNSTEQQAQQQQRHPLLYVDINLAADKLERIVVYEGDRPEDLARAFIQQHGLDDVLQEKLTQMLEMQIEANRQQQQQQQQQNLGE